MKMKKDSLSQRRNLLYKHLNPLAWDGERPSMVPFVIMALILMSLVLFTLETENTVQGRYPAVFAILNLILAVLFGIEYALRLWVCVENPLYAKKWGRLKFARSPMAIIDLIAFLPALIFVGGSSAYWLRIIRVVRILRLLKLGRYSSSLKLVISAIRKSRRELIVTFAAALFFLYLSAVLLYFVEGEAQPEAFGSVPRAIWWAVATLTTVGYGDVYPITPLGKIFAGMVALIGVAIVALPAGILAGGFIEEFKAQRQRDAQNKE